MKTLYFIAILAAAGILATFLTLNENRTKREKADLESELHFTKIMLVSCRDSVHLLAPPLGKQPEPVKPEPVQSELPSMVREYTTMKTEAFVDGYYIGFKMMAECSHKIRDGALSEDVIEWGKSNVYASVLIYSNAIYSQTMKEIGK